MNNKTIVFVGPTLSGLSDFQNELSEHCVFHGPIKCGDLLEARKEKYKSAVIVDGLFETVPSVWHKEILDFVDKGGVVFGCSSMGALRAVECGSFGMIGFGKIYEDFRCGRILDDDEVTVAHLGKSHGYLPLSDAMVNIRYTVADAVKKGALSSEDSGRILGIAKAIFYRKRSLKDIVKRELKTSEDLQDFKNYLNAEGIVDQKKLDAIQLLKNLPSLLQAASAVSRNNVKEPYRDSGTIRKLKFSCSTRPSALEGHALGPDARITKMTRLFFGKTYSMLQDLAVALMGFDAIRDFKIYSKSNLAGQGVSWLRDGWLEGEMCSPLFSEALQVCTEYRDFAKIPMTVRVLSFMYEVPIETLDRKTLFEDDSMLQLDSDLRQVRILYLIGLFLDSRFEKDAKTKIYQPPQIVVAQKRAAFKAVHGESEASQAEYLKNFGLTNLDDVLIKCEILSYFLQPPTGTIAFPIYSDVYDWYTMACQMCGFSEQLKSLLLPEVRKAFALELYFNFVLMSPQHRIISLRTSGLPTNLLGPDSIIKYINSELCLKE